MTTITLTREELADLIGAIDVSLGEGQQGTIVARALHAQGITIGPDALDAIRPRPPARPPACIHLDATSKLRIRLMRAELTPGGELIETCACGEVLRGKVKS